MGPSLQGACLGSELSNFPPWPCDLSPWGARLRVTDANHHWWFAGWFTLRVLHLITLLPVNTLHNCCLLPWAEDIDKNRLDMRWQYEQKSPGHFNSQHPFQKLTSSTCSWARSEAPVVPVVHFLHPDVGGPMVLEIWGDAWNLGTWSLVAWNLRLGSVLATFLFWKVHLRLGEWKHHPTLHLPSLSAWPTGGAAGWPRPRYESEQSGREHLQRET